jgi:hypothetical protein
VRRVPPLVLVLALAACASGGGPARTGTSEPPTAPAVTTTTSTGAPPTTSPSTPAVTTPETPDPRQVPVSSLLRSDTSRLRALYGDLDGDGIDEIVLAARASNPPSGAALAQDYLDVFAWDGTRFARVFAATEGAPAGHGAPGTMIAVPPPEQVSQTLQFLALVRFRPDEALDLAVGVLNVGAGAGPLDVWVVRMQGGGFRTEFFESTVSGGILTTTGTGLELDTPNFAPSDPHCCPSRIEHQVIGADPATGRIAVLRRTFTAS